MPANLYLQPNAPSDNIVWSGIIRLRRGAAMWYADWRDTDQADYARSIYYGTTLVPLPFAAGVPADRVVAHVARLNPAYSVTIAPSERS